MNYLILIVWALLTFYFLYLFITLAKKESNISWPFATILLVFFLAGFFYFLVINNYIEGLNFVFGDKGFSIKLRDYLKSEGSDIQRLVDESALPRPLSGNISDKGIAKKIYRMGVLHEVLKEVNPGTTSEATHYAYIISLLIDEKDQIALEEGIDFVNKYKTTNHRLTPLVHEFIADNYLGKDDLTKAEDNYQQSLQLLKDFSSEYYSDKARIAKKLSSIFEKRGMNQQAINYLKKAIEYYRKPSYEEKLQYLKIQPEIINVYQKLEKALNKGDEQMLASLYSNNYPGRQDVLSSLKGYFKKNNMISDVSVINYDKSHEIVEVEVEATLNAGAIRYTSIDKLKKDGQNWLFFKESKQ